VIGLANKRGYTCIDRTVIPEELKDFKECFIVITAAEVLPIKSVGDYEFTPWCVRNSPERLHGRPPAGQGNRQITRVSGGKAPKPIITELQAQ
jgi:hypothetical protein